MIKTIGLFVVASALMLVSWIFNPNKPPPPPLCVTTSPEVSGWRLWSVRVNWAVQRDDELRFCRKRGGISVVAGTYGDYTIECFMRADEAAELETRLSEKNASGGGE